MKGEWEKKKRKKKERREPRERKHKAPPRRPLSLFLRSFSSFSSNPSIVPPHDPPNIEQHSLSKSLRSSEIKLVRIHRGNMSTSGVKMLEMFVDAYVHTYTLDNSLNINMFSM